MIIDLIKDKTGPQAYKTLVQLFGEPQAVSDLRSELQSAQNALSQQERQASEAAREFEKKEEQLREERLSWMAKESAVRKELQDSQERGKDLLEQVVRLTHQKREKAKDLLDQKFKSEATPSERNRFELELTEARGKVRRADEKVKQNEEKMSRNQAQFDSLRKQAKDAKKLEADLAWTRKQSEAHLTALGAAITKIRLIEGLLDKLETTRKALPLKRYLSPTIGETNKRVQNAFRALVA